jgi:hypothetical protein
MCNKIGVAIVGIFLCYGFRLFFALSIKIESYLDDNHFYFLNQFSFYVIQFSIIVVSKTY